MTKKRRTRKEKIVAGSRNNDFAFVFDIKPEKKDKTFPGPEKVSATNSRNYTYVLAEAKNTLLITCVIIAINLLLFIALKQNYINIFGLRF